MFFCLCFRVRPMIHSNAVAATDLLRSMFRFTLLLKSFYFYSITNVFSMIWLRKWLIFHWLALTPYSRQGILLVYSWALHSVEMICFFCHRGILSFFPLGAGQFGPLTFYLSVFFFCYFPLPHELKIVIDYFMSSIATELIDFLCIDLVNILLDPHQHIWPSWGFCECCDFLVSILWTELLLDGPSDGCGLA